MVKSVKITKTLTGRLNFKRKIKGFIQLKKRAKFLVFCRGDKKTLNLLKNYGKKCKNR